MAKQHNEDIVLWVSRLEMFYHNGLGFYGQLKAAEESVLKPYAQRTLNRERRIFNYHLSRARGIVENALGIMAAIFHVFHTSINAQPHKVDKYISAGCMYTA